MTKNEMGQNQGTAANVEKPKRKFAKHIFFLKLFAILLLILFGYFGFRYFKLKALNKSEISKFDNIESEIFDLSESDKNRSRSDLSGHSDSQLTEITTTELREGGAEFIYQLLLKNQVQISDANAKIKVLSDEFDKYKMQEKIGKVIFAYIELRQKIYEGEDFSKEVENVELLVTFDRKLQEKTSRLKMNLKKFTSAKNLQDEFSALIPNLIAAKKYNEEGNWIEQVRYNLSKLIVVRKLEDNDATVDGLIYKTEQFLQQKDYQNALNALNSMNNNKNKSLNEYIEKVKNAAAIQAIDQEIMVYLRSLT